MPVFVEAGSQNPKGGVSAARQDEAHDEQVEQVDALDETHVGSQYGAINLDSHHAAQAMHHLPSPSPTPSPRGSSSSLAVSNSGDGTLYPHHNGRGSSGSFENPAVSIMDSAENEDRVPLSPLLVSKTRPPRDLDDIPEKIRKPSKLSITTRSHGNEKTYKLTAAEMEELTSAPESLPLTPSRSPLPVAPPLAPSPVVERNGSASDASHYRSDEQQRDNRYGKYSNLESLASSIDANDDRRPTGETTPLNVNGRRPNFSSRGVSSPQFSDTRIPSSHTKVSSNPISPKRKPVPSGARPEHLDTNLPKSATPAGKSSSLDPPPSPIPQSIPLPPMSIPTYLQLELSSSMPSPLYIYRSSTSDNVYESSKIKFERLLNFLLLQPQLEQVLVFGSFACLDAWLYTFTILPLRFLKAASILIQWWGQALAKEIQFISGFIYHGLGRMWHRQRGRAEITDSAPQSRNVSQASQPHASATSHQPQSGGTLKSSNGNTFAENLKSEVEYKSRQGWGRRHRRTRSQPSSLSSNHKADLLQGAVIICSCIILMKLDASRMYHSIRGQATIKLYVIYNVLEVRRLGFSLTRLMLMCFQVCDKLFSALGQDIFECLFSVETLGRDLHGRSKVIRPLGMFILALIYNVIHATALFYQVVTLNVAVNSYSNALLTLLMSNQFVEIKSSVFKKIEKDNLFQLTCADVVERFQLWLMLMIIALRNIVEVGGLSIVNNGISGAEFVKESVPIRTNSILPVSFTILPSWAGEVLSPFLLVIGSEMLVDWVKHAYINKFNNVKPAIYQRYLDILGKDYYTNVRLFHLY
jgi:hypothetical protein